MWKLQSGIGGNFILGNKFKFKLLSLCTHNFQYTILQFHVLKFNISMVLFTITFCKPFVLAFSSHNLTLTWSKPAFNRLCNVDQYTFQPDAHSMSFTYHMTWELLWPESCYWLIHSSVEKLWRFNEQSPRNRALYAAHYMQ